MTNVRSFDVMVIGAGVMGCAAAYHLAKAGQRVLLLEQFQIGHTHGSSHGGSRIIRYTHDDAEFTQWMPATFALWRQLEAESGQPLLQLTGGLYLGLADDPFFRGAQQVLQQFHFPYRVLTAPEMQKAFPQFRLPTDWITLEQAETGILAATRCVQTLAAQAVRHGAVVQELSKVLALQPAGEGVKVRVATQGTETELYARRAIISAGPWVHQLLDPLLGYVLPLTPTHQQIAYFRAEQPALYSLGHFPLFLCVDDGPGAYGFPIFEEPGYVKVAIELVNTPIDPDRPAVIDQTALAQLSQIVDELLVGVNPTPEFVASCRYTETPNRDFIIDYHPTHPQIIFATGFSGRGFKHGIAIGQVLATMAQGEAGVYPTNFWSPRFALQAFRPAYATGA